MNTPDLRPGELARVLLWIAQNFLIFVAVAITNGWNRYSSKAQGFPCFSPPSVPIIDKRVHFVDSVKGSDRLKSFLLVYAFGVYLGLSYGRPQGSVHLGDEPNQAPAAGLKTTRKR